MTVSILVVDDEADVAELFRQRFRRETRQGTYVMHFAASGEQALDLVTSEMQPELSVILSDGTVNLLGRVSGMRPTGSGHWLHCKPMPQISAQIWNFLVL